MTLSELLEELKQIDPETYEALRNYPLYVSGDEALSVDLPGSRNQTLCEDAIQGCLQRACERRGWDLRQDQWVVDIDSTNEVYYYSSIVTGISETGRSPEYEGRGKSQAEALLTAYVAAIKGEML